MSGSPLVGATSYTPCESDRSDYYLPHQYVSALQATGVSPVLLVGGEPGAALERIDGLVLSGGGDIASSFYGSQRHAASYMVDPQRDRYEMDLAVGALEKGIPVFAICRGLQIVNVALGGTLFQHIPDEFDGSVSHRLPPREPVLHTVAVEFDSTVLRSTTGADDFEVMSWHHQAVDTLGAGLRVTARAADGVVEAVELAAASWFLGVQWHPELNAGREPRQAALFAEFAKSASDHHRTKQ